MSLHLKDEVYKIIILFLLGSGTSWLKKNKRFDEY